MELVLVSACLAGVPCRYDGRSRPDQTVVDGVAEGWAIPACAEQLGGMQTPRPPAEIAGGDGHDVLDGDAQVLTIDGDDVTREFVEGARAVAEIVEERGITRAILQARSPSCGGGSIYDGTHSGGLINGDGVLAAMLKQRGIAVESLRGLSGDSPA